MQHIQRPALIKYVRDNVQQASYRCEINPDMHHPEGVYFTTMTR